MKHALFGLVCFLSLTISGLARPPLAPVITQDLTNETVCIGATAVFAISASGREPLAYQWQFDGANLPGATAADYVITNAQPVNAGSYDVIVNNAYGEATSSVVQLTVLETPCSNCCAGCTVPYPLSYTNVVNPETYAFLADNLCQGTNNNVNDILTNVADDTVLYLYNSNTGFTADATYYDAADSPNGAAGWFDQNGNPSTLTLSAGEGFVLYNGSTVPFDLVIQGCEPTCPPPCLPPTNGMSLVGSLGIGPATWTNLFSCPPPCGAQMQFWNGSAFTDYNFYNQAWHTANGTVVSAPVVPIGDAVLVSVQSNTNCQTNCCAGCAPPYPDSYTLTVSPGVENYLADNLCQGTNNTLSDILSNVPVKSRVSVWNVGSQTFVSSTKAVSGWNDNLSLSPGEGFVLTIPGTTPLTLTISGCPPTCPAPCSPPTNALVLEGDFGDSAGTWTNLFSCPPPCGAQMLFWNGTGYTAYNYYGQEWHDASGNVVPAPVVAVGESVFASVVTTNMLSVACSMPKSVQCGSNWVFDVPSASSCCGTNITINILQTTTNSTGACPGSFTATRVWQISDGCGNGATCTQTVAVVDTVPPVITGCQNISANAAAGLSGAYVSFTVTALDDCSGPVPVTCLPPSGSFFPCGTNTVECTATNLCGYATNCSFEVVVNCSCVTVSNQVFAAVSNSPGSYTWSFNLQNNASVPVEYLLLVPQSGCFTVRPDILTFHPQLQPAQTTNLNVQLSVTGTCGSNLCLLMSLEDSNLVTCCSREICFRLDTNPPAIQCPAPQTVCGPTNGVSLTLTAVATDPGGEPLAIQWFVDGALVQYGGLTLTRTFSLGIHNVEVTASDGQSLASCTTTVTVLAKPVVTIQLVGADIVVTWTGGGVLQSAMSVAGPYIDVPGATSPYSSPLSTGSVFYRVQCP